MTANQQFFLKDGPKILPWWIQKGTNQLHKTWNIHTSWAFVCPMSALTTFKTSISVTLTSCLHLLLPHLTFILGSRHVTSFSFVCLDLHVQTYEVVIGWCLCSRKESNVRHWIDMGLCNVRLIRCIYIFFFIYFTTIIITLD